MKLIGFCGYKQSGKNTAAEYFRCNLPHAICLAFADGVKESVAEAFGCTVKQIEESKSNPIVRHLLQWVGTEYARAEKGEYVWIKDVERKMIDKDAIYIITDVRFPNESQWITDRGGVLIKVERAGLVNTDNHPSETNVDKLHPDWRLANNGNSLREFYRECNWVLSYVKERFKL
jgi:hypothetical protein